MTAQEFEALPETEQLRLERVAIVAEGCGVTWEEAEEMAGNKQKGEI